jgi:hypothetical protein
MNRLEIALRIFCSVQRAGLMGGDDVYESQVQGAFRIADMVLQAAKPLCSWCWPPFPVHTCALCKAVLCAGVSHDTNTRHGATLVEYYCEGCRTNFCHSCLAKHEHRPTAG